MSEIYLSPALKILIIKNTSKRVRSQFKKKSGAGQIFYCLYKRFHFQTDCATVLKFTTDLPALKKSKIRFKNIFFVFKKFKTIIFSRKKIKKRLHQQSTA